MDKVLNNSKVLAIAYLVAIILLLVLISLIISNYQLNNQALTNIATTSTGQRTLTVAERNRILDSLQTGLTTNPGQSIFDGSAPAPIDQKRERAILKSLETSPKPALTAEQRQAVLRSLQSAN